MASPKWWSRRKGWIAFAAAGACALILAALVVLRAIGAGSGPWAVLSLLAVGIVTFVTTLLVTEGAPWQSEQWTDWLEVQPISFIFLAIFAAIGAMLVVLDLIGSDEFNTKQVVIERPPKSGPPPRIRLKLPGIWGEQGCAVTYRFQIRERAVIVDSVLRPAGRQPHHLVATIISAEGDVMNVAGEQPEIARGKAATFTYVWNGATEQLIWDDQVGQVRLELDRCQ